MTSYRRRAPHVLGWLLPLLAVSFLASVAAAADADHLIISEAMIKTRTNNNISPYITITNPTAGDIDMSDVYLTDAYFSPSAMYYNLPLADPGTSVIGGGSGGDFHVRFPDGYTMAAGDVLVISINGSDEYESAYGEFPDFELFEDGDEPDEVPEMRAAFPGSVNAGLAGGTNTPELSDVAESLILYTWDQSSDLVEDLDYATWGTNTAVRMDKTGVTIGSGTYAADTVVGSQDPIDTTGHNFGESFKRVSADEGTETAAAGNGTTGHDESSENLGTTWAVVGTVAPPAEPASFFAPAPIFLSLAVSPATPNASQSASLEAMVISDPAVSSVAFYYRVDGAGWVSVAGADQGADTWAATVPTQAEAAVVDWYCVADNGGSELEGPAGAPVFFESYTVSEAPAGNGPPKLLLTQICTKPTAGEFFQIHNPNDAAVDMSDYYVSDAIYAPNSQFYWRIAEGSPSATTAGGGTYGDFHARFPDGYTIAAGDTIVISTAGSAAFNSTYSMMPDLELYEDDGSADGIPDMRPIFTDGQWDSIVGDGSTPGLSNASESLTLYHWVDTDDLVTDIDFFLWGTSTSVRYDKNGVTVGSSTYQADTATGSQSPFTAEHDMEMSYVRTDYTEGNQTTTGGNGVDGRDETSEDLNNTFEIMDVDPGGGGSGPGPVDPAVKLLITQICVQPTANEFIEIYNPSSGAVDLSDYYLTDAIYATNSQYYWRIAEGSPSADTAGGGTFGDFHARFPDGYSISAGDTIVITVAGSVAYSGAYGFMPDLELFEDDPSADDIPDMRPIFINGIYDSIVGDGSTPGLSNGSESVTLYHWVDGDDLVTDVDMFLWGTSTSVRYDKTGVTVGSSTYQADTAVGSQSSFATEHSAENAYVRTDGNEGSQTTTGGNGVGGRDETSENLDTTFADLPADPSNPDAGPGPVGPVAKLLLTEVCTKPTAREFIEIYNPSDEDVDMSRYHITDAIYATNSQFYWRIAEGNPSATTAGGGTYGDFHARFPDGFEIAAGDTIVISVAGSASFASEYGFLPDLELYEDDLAADSVPDMEPIFTNGQYNSIVGDGSTPGLSNGSESLTLYHWDDGADLVTDVDFFLWGEYDSVRYDKTGVTVGSSTYLPDTDTDSQRPYVAEHDMENSYTRIDGSEGSQTTSGGNGVGGRDETSEDLDNTFDNLPATPSRPTSGGGEEGDGKGANLIVEAKTFIPYLGENFPISFVSKSNSETKVRIFDLEGRQIITLFDSRFNGPPSILPDAPSIVIWDGRDSTFERVKAGMYIVHLSVVDKRTGDEESFTAPVVVATRLSRQDG